MRKKTVVTIACFTLAALAATLPAWAACDNSTIAGAYGYHAHGFGQNGVPEAFVPGGASLPGALVGAIGFDGAGNITSGSQKTAVAGTALPLLPFAGYYSVNPDCSGTVTRVLPNGSRVTWRIEVVHDGDEILFLFVDPGVTIEGEMIRR